MVIKDGAKVVTDCEEFVGIIEKFDEEENLAYFTLKSEDGEEFEGEYNLAEMKASGIRERRRFKCKITTTVEFIDIPDREISDEEYRAKREEIDRILSSFGPDDAPQSDY